MLKAPTSTSWTRFVAYAQETMWINAHEAPALKNGWTGMHFATKAGHLNVVKLFVKSSADELAETKEGKVGIHRFSVILLKIQKNPCPCLRSRCALLPHTIT